jgi:type I restriction enzyme, R subunit
MLTTGRQGHSAKLLTPSNMHDRPASGFTGLSAETLPGRPEDFLDNFTSFVRNNVNKIAALAVVVQRPRELTRAQLGELQLELANQGFTDTALRTAWQQSKNEDIAASIIGFIRQAAIGDPLEPFEDRVHKAIRKIESRGTWPQPQRAWLRRIGEQLVQELVVDHAAR